MLTVISKRWKQNIGATQKSKKPPFWMVSKILAWQVIWYRFCIFKREKRLELWIRNSLFLDDFLLKNVFVFLWKPTPKVATTRFYIHEVMQSEVTQKREKVVRLFGTIFKGEIDLSWWISLFGRLFSKNVLVLLEIQCKQTFFQQLTTDQSATTLKVGQGVEACSYWYIFCIFQMKMT